ncbi:hypothetical protein CEK69_16090 [Xanthomonas sp. LMG 12462]|nr:hypothetical protein CEK69_16090 [Xanthomonas sp. LMG 12462]
MHPACRWRAVTLAVVPARAADGTGITAGIPVDRLVLSGNTGIVLSGNESSCYQATKFAGKPRLVRLSTPRNVPNLVSNIGGRSAAIRWITASRHALASAMGRAAP